MIRIWLVAMSVALVAWAESRASDAQPLLSPEEASVLTLEGFIQQATSRDTEFEAILINELALKYSKALALPPGDIIASVKRDYQAFSSAGRVAGATEVGLSKLFPRSATEVAALYDATPSFTEDEVSSGLSFTLSQPIARNAFGRSTRLLDKITGLEVDVARHQVVEAYEDYLAGIIVAYHAWYEAHENLLIARSSYRENLKLLDNVKQRQKQQVARPVDVNKIELQLLAKRERVIELEEEYANRTITVYRVIRHKGDRTLRPTAPETRDVDGTFEDQFRIFTQQSRTFSMLALLEEKSALEVDREADDILPSLALVAGFEVRGEEYGLEHSDNMVSVGFRLEWPIPSQDERAEHEIAKLDLRRSELNHLNARHRLYQDIRNLFLEIQKNKELMTVADQKIALAQSVVKDETENYSFGRVSLNDYIAAVNVLDSNRFNKILRESRYRRLVAEWLRLTDRLVTREDIQDLPANH